ncbi:MAG TPA: 4-hydroxyphenylacetate decarboxylase large subunit [Candidatus Mailhella merdigallinarum]|uniref:4-hydroxyphenylacetate decarboxylase large subunit n=1 Tax=Candidatus Mailhella merdigallinarum TaxID=2838658 RepID=A0A9D2HDJ5_9BACT|nr:4-hydroxyphenylacetate decarboxylase large subunit [Desulfovibrionaceae bacterium]PWM69292.1 MAG: MFS transporter [Desulfovibrionaceae bacterium]HJA08201.1 4-hydroxyphenylacetate decarboxylase large subunit [Candidatus Mailhella merdigallinarum]
MQATSRKLADILAEKGMGLNRTYGGTGGNENEIADRETFPYEPTPRAKKLMDLYYNTLASTSTEWTYWYTRKYEQLEGEIQIMRRAHSLAAAFSRVTTSIYPGEIIVGGKACYLRGSFPMPWLIQAFFAAKKEEFSQKAGATINAIDAQAVLGTGGGNVTHDMPGIVSLAGKFGVRTEELPGLNRITDYWDGKTILDLGEKYSARVPEFHTKNELGRTLTARPDSAYTIPVGREVVSYYYPLQMGLDGMIEFCRRRAAEVAGYADGDGLRGMDRLYYYEAVIVLVKGIQTWIQNYAKEARRLSGLTRDAAQKAEYAAIAERCDWVAHNQPRTLFEAMQLCWFTHLGLVNEEVASGISPGRLGQVLYPWFEQDLEAGRLTEHDVLEMLECMRVKFTCMDLFVSGSSTSVLSGNTFNNVSVGGLTRDGKPACNRLEWLILHAAETLQSPQPTLSVLWDEKLPRDFVLKCAEVVKTGTGYPAWMNNQVGIKFLCKQYAPEGMTEEEARAMAIGGCLETSPCCWKELTLNGKTYEIPVGAGNSTSIGVHFISNPKILSLVLDNGYDHKYKVQLFPPHDKKLETYEELWETYCEYYKYCIRVQQRCCNIQHDIHRKIDVPVWQSTLKPDCLEKGYEHANMGFRYNATYNIETSGTISMVNALAALKKLVYEDKKYTLDQMRDAIHNNFGFYTASETKNYSMGEQIKKENMERYDDIHSDCLLAPKYGNDEGYCEAILKQYEDWLIPTCAEFESPFGKPMYACQISVSTHGLLGQGCMATPDGRLEGTTFADASMSAYPGTDRNGPYALFNSATVWDHSDSQNSQMNMKLHPTAVRGEAGTERLADLVGAYMKKGGFHIQFNVVDSKLLKKAQSNPENYRDLMVRVAGFTQYWVEIGKPIQDELVARTEYEGV